MLIIPEDILFKHATANNVQYATANNVQYGTANDVEDGNG